uniref:TF-B3 domain-containing protein n=1 Tax=Oryza meridionalis TaxID=40149 RepID=A0A0E0FDM5_9ORYZ
MRKSFTTCKECIFYHYWNHMGDQKRSFINVMIGDFVPNALHEVHSKLDVGLIWLFLQAVPTKFANIIRGQISEVVKLEVPNGKTYDVQVAKEQNELVLRSGWGAFARDYELKQCDILVFTYSGSSRFKVRIFNPSGCEKELSCVMMNSTPCGHEGSMPYHDNHVQSPSERSSQHATVLPPVLLDKPVTIPKMFAKNVQGQISGVAKLEVPDGRTYDVEIAKEHNELVFRSGWEVFASAYELEQGDILVFAYSGNSHFKVQIFNPSNCEKELSCVMMNRSISDDNHRQSPSWERMNKSGTTCMDCITNHYWLHMDDRERYFFKVMMSVSDIKDELAIPKKFTANVRGKIPEQVRLEVSDGKMYNVQVTEEQDELVLRSGWANFASTYQLKHGDLLVFIHSGHSHFKVLIFDPSYTEKEFSCVVTDSTSHVHERSISHDNHLQSPRSVILGKNYSLCSSRKRSRMNPADYPSQRPDVPSSEDIKDPMSSGGLQKSKKSCYVLPMLYSMTSAQEAEVLALEKKIQPQIPLYITAMDISVASGSLVFSKDYAVRYLLDQNRTIKLCQSGGSKTWDISLDMDTDDLYALSTGWLDFFRGNLLQEGDICVFEASKSKRGVALTFHPFKESHCPKSSEYTLSTKSPTRRVPKRDYFATNLTNLTDQQERKCFSVKYASKYLPHEDQNMRLRLPETKYKCKAALRVDTSTNLHKLLKGWGKFVNDNKLEVHDICLFQLMKNKKKLTMTVHIIRKGECSGSLCCRCCGMEKSHRVCKNCVANHYWLHMDNHGKSFIKVMITDFKNGVTIPAKFARNFGGQMSGTVKLETRNGKTYEVQVAKELNNLVLRSGWERFASAYELEKGDILVFIQSGNSHFKVWIYDPSACEKELPCIITEQLPRVQQRSISHDNHTRLKRNAKSAKLYVDSSGHTKETSEINPASSPSWKPTERVPFSEELDEPVDLANVQKATKSFYSLPRMCNLTSAQKAEVDALEKRIKPQIPFYITVIDKASATDGLLAISKDYAVSYLLDKNETIKLCHSGRSLTWDIGLDIDTDDQYALSTGWLDFIRNNHLQEGDICVFEASKNKRGVALIFHPLKQSHHPKPPGCVPSTKFPRHGVSKPNYIVSRFTTLSGQLKIKVEAKVQAIQSEVPIFVAVMRESFIRGRSRYMCFSAKYAAKYLPRENNKIMRLRLPKKSYKYKAVFKINNKVHKLGGGWGKFVDDNKLKLGDICLFQLMKDKKKLTMMVMGEKGCESCRKWQEHYYKEHMDVSRIRFFRLMTGDFAHGISIPEKVAEIFSGQITKGFNLKSPSGETWRVGIEKVADELILMSGWEDFAKAHELQENDLLFFTCNGHGNGSCSFDVLIFDASGCEKVSCFFTGKKNSYMCKNFNSIGGQIAGKYLSSDSEDTSTPSVLIGSPHKASTSKKLSGKTKTNPRKEPEDPNCSHWHVIEEKNTDDDEHADYHYTRFANYLTGEERDEIFSLVSLQPGNPVFVAVLQTAHVRRRNILIVPTRFAADHLERKSHDILLIRPNRKQKWSVKYYYLSNTTRGFNCHRWIKFIRENRLREGNVCIFELMKGARRPTMTVHVICKADNRFVLLS